jgi:hypothetical protein
MATINGTAGDDTLSTGSGGNVVRAGDGNDRIEDLNGVRDTVFAGAGDDVFVSAQTGGGSDLVFMEGGNDTVFLGRVSTGRGGQNETVDGGGGLDTFDYSNYPTATINVDLAEDGRVVSTQLVSENNYLNFENVTGNQASNVISGNSSDNVLIGNGGNDILDGEGGNDLLDGGTGADAIDGGNGNDTLLGGDGADNLDGGAGDDRLEGGAGVDSLDGGSGNDTLIGGDGPDILTGGSGNDSILSDGLDAVFGGADADTITIQPENDLLFGTVVNVDGGLTGDDNDTLDLSALIADGWSISSFIRLPDLGNVPILPTGNPGFTGNVTLVKDGNFYTINYTDIENFAICFTPGTQIATAKGRRNVETLKVGDQVVTRDNGLQEIAWIGQRTLSQIDLMAAPQFQPVVVKANSFGDGVPMRDMALSANHRVLLASPEMSLMFGESEVLSPAKYLVGREGVERQTVNEVTYIHILFKQHEIILSDGMWTESFQPGAFSMRGLADDQRAEIISLFPELGNSAGLDTYSAARMSLKKKEAALLL